MSRVKSFSDKVMDSIADHLGLYIFLGAIGLITFMFTTTYTNYTIKIYVRNLDSNVCEMAKMKANKTAVNHLSDQVYQIDTATNRKQIRELYHELTHQPPEITRGAVERMSFNLRSRAVNVWNMPIICYSDNTE
jgi:hypothetical protein